MPWTDAREPATCFVYHPPIVSVPMAVSTAAATPAPGKMAAAVPSPFLGGSQSRLDPLGEAWGGKAAHVKSSRCDGT